MYILNECPQCMFYIDEIEKSLKWMVLKEQITLVLKEKYLEKFQYI